MNPATQLGEEDVGQILRRYNLRLRSVEPICRGTINSNYRVDTDAGPAFLRVNEGKSRADADFEAELVWHLGSRGLPTPQLWRTRASEPFVMWRREPHGVARPVMLMTWLDGRELTENELSPDHTYVVGALLGQLHLCAAGFPQARLGIYTMARIRDRLRRMQGDERAVAEVGPLLAELAQELAELTPSRPRDLPSGLCHGDLFPDNLIFDARWSARQPSKQEAPSRDSHPGPHGYILDLEQAATLPFIYDVAVALLSFCCGPVLVPGAQPAIAGPLDAALARALVEGYQTMRLLSDAEWSALPGELRWVAVRFTTTRLTDIERYGSRRPPAPLPEQPPPQDCAPPAPKSKKRSRRAAPPSPMHSKDYRDYARRLTLLRAQSRDDLYKILR